MPANSRRSRRHARRASLAQFAPIAPALVYWGVTYADRTVALYRGARGETLIKVAKSDAARAARAAAHLN